MLPDQAKITAPHPAYGVQKDLLLCAAGTLMRVQREKQLHLRLMLCLPEGLQAAGSHSFIHSFIHSFLGRWANHDHLTSSLKHIINQTNI